MSKDNPRTHQGTVTFEQTPGMQFEVWSYRQGADREFHVAVVGPDGHTIAQGKFRIRPAARREGRDAKR